MPLPQKRQDSLKHATNLYLLLAFQTSLLSLSLSLLSTQTFASFALSIDCFAFTFALPIIIPLCFTAAGAQGTAVAAAAYTQYTNDKGRGLV